jgi:hypothetical protein
VFHIHAHLPDGIWFWAIAVLPFALCLDTLLLHILYASLLAVWVGTEILGYADLGPWLFRNWTTLPNAAYTLPLLVLPGILWAYRKQSATTIAVYAPVLAWWVVLLPVAWRWEVNPIYFVGLSGALFLIAAEGHRVGSRLAIPYRLYGVLITAGVLVPLGFADFQMEMQRHSAAGMSYAAGLVIALVTTIAALGLARLQARGSGGRKGAGATVPAVLQRQWLPLALVLLMVGLCLWNGAFSTHGATYHRSDYAARQLERWTAPVLVPAAAANAAMIVLALWLMHVGLREDRAMPFAAGVVYFLLWAVLRYVDLFGGIGGMLGAALMFLLCGVGLYGVARFWQHRKETKHA